MNDLKKRRTTQRKATFLCLKVFALCTLLLHVTDVFSQNRAVSGTVVEENGTPIAGATVMVRGTTFGTSTDINGRFSLSVPASARTVQVSFIGMVTEEAVLSSDMRVILKADVQQLDEVMVVAYGTSRKSSFTGSASLVKSDKLEVRPLTNVTSALLGAAPGVQVSSANGHPGSESDIYIRGIGSYAASNTPLIILNGMPYDNSISSINPSDIESITVLKDAASSALYGSRAANGVVMITTKTGKKERMTVNVKFNQGITARQTNDYRKVNTADYLLLYWENLRNRYLADGQSADEAARMAADNLISDLKYNPYNVPANQVVDTNGKLNPNAQFQWSDDTDWVNALQQLGNRTDAALSVGGGSDRSDYYASVGYTTEEGYILGSAFERYTLSGNVNSQITKWLKTGVNLSGNLSKTEGIQDETSGNLSNPFRFMRYVGPLYPIHLHDPDTKAYLLDENGNKIYDFGTGYNVGGIETPRRDFVSGNNPAIELQNIQNGNRRNTLNAKAYAEISLPAGFMLSLNGSVGTNAYLASSASIVYPEKGNTGNVTKTNSFTTTWTYNQLLSYTNDFGRHHIDVLAGHESYDYEYNYLRASMKDQKFDGNYEFGNYSNLNTTPNSYTHTYTTEGFLSRFNYAYDNRYFLSGSFRRDGSSRFYKDSRWGNFWSIGGGWRVDREAFLRDLAWLNNLKLRASYGEVGNDNVGSYYPWRATYEIAQNAAEAGFIQSSLENKELKWEVSHNSDVALEFALFDSRLSGTMEYFNRQSGNLLFSVPLSPSTGVDDVDMNTGTMYNRGWEIDLNGRLIESKDFALNIGLNATWLQNKITKLPVDPFVSSVFKIEEGHARYEYWLRQWEGVYSETGDCLYLPTDEALANESSNLVTVDGRTYTTNIEEAKYDYSGVASPKLSGGLSVNASFRGFSLALNFYYQLGGQMYDMAYSTLMTPGTTSLAYSNLHEDLLGRWQKPGDRTNVPRISNTNATSLNADNSTRWLVSSDLLELANVNLSYDLPKAIVSRLDLGGARLYVSADNVFQVTQRQGIYPRRNIFSGYSSNGDVYLPSRVFTLGLNLTF
ncbi:MAG: TonB-dependent receptor [Tannerellaceae bacterium]|jgi:TonB-linked SusC/RagA family outer membrane protein|nr:TonB-dependent receptor [Tannerellaceae bacterium]